MSTAAPSNPPANCRPSHKDQHQEGTGNDNSFEPPFVLWAIDVLPEDVRWQRRIGNANRVTFKALIVTLQPPALVCEWSLRSEMLRRCNLNHVNFLCLSHCQKGNKHRIQAW